MRVRPSPVATISAVNNYVVVPCSSCSLMIAVLSTDAPSESARSSCWTSSARIAAKSGLSGGGSAGGGEAGAGGRVLTEERHAECEWRQTQRHFIHGPARERRPLVL